MQRCHGGTNGFGEDQHTCRHTNPLASEWWREIGVEPTYDVLTIAD